MISIGINGIGRIGRALFRIINLFPDLKVIKINDLNPEVDNIVYLLKYDSYYGRFNYNIRPNGKSFFFKESKVVVTHEKNIDEVDWTGCDIVIESAGVHSNLEKLPSILSCGVHRVLVTYSPEAVDHTIILGANEDSFDENNHKIISSSICDAVAFAPIYKMIEEHFGVEGGFLKTLHPWLAYQNLLDGPSVSWGKPGELYHHYALGRASTASIIPKPTTAIAAVSKVFPDIIDKMKCYSFRIPTPVVGAADITFKLKTRIRINDLIDVISNYQKNQIWPIIYLNTEPLVSVDFTGTDYSAVIDNRWMEVINGDLLNMTLWYDNEWAYSRRVIDLLRYIMKLSPAYILNEENSLS